MVKNAVFPYVLPLGLLPLGLIYAQPPANTPAKPDSEAVKTLIEKAKKAGGPMWAGEEHFFCEAPRANSPNLRYSGNTRRLLRYPTGVGRPFTYRSRTLRQPKPTMRPAC